MWHKNLIFVGAMLELLSNISYMLHKIHSHCHLILDPKSAYDDFGRVFTPLEVIVKCRFTPSFGIQDQVAMAMDFMQNIRTFLMSNIRTFDKVLAFDKDKVLVTHHPL